MQKRLFLSLLISCTLALSGCSLFGGGKKKGEGDDGISENDLSNQQEDRFGSGNIPLAQGEGLFRDVSFDYDSSSISDAARQDIESNVSVLESNPNITVVLEGHCDERGTQEYNLNLGQNRASAVQNVLESLGISSSRIEIISYGENVPLALGHDEGSFAKNRRVHFAAKGSASEGKAKKSGSGSLDRY